MRSTVSTLLVAMLMAASAQAQIPAPTTQTGSVSKDSPKVYSFTPAAFGQVMATLSWDAPNAHLVMVLMCGTADPHSFGIAAGWMDRFARFEAGIIGGDPCALAITSADEPTNFRLHVTRTGDQALTAAAAGFAAFAEARPGLYLADEALRVLARVTQRMPR